MGKIHTTTVTFLEMTSAPGKRIPSPARTLALMRAVSPPLHFYRYLYDVVGRDYLWVSRKRLSDADLHGIICNEQVEIYVLYVDGVPAGFAELDFRTAGEAELSYMGLVPGFVGMGLGQYLLAQATAIAWAHPIKRFKVQTCTLDHARALGLYQRMGFVPYAQTQAEIEEID